MAIAALAAFAAPAPAQTPPPGYTIAREGPLTVLRPDGEADREVAIVVHPPLGSAGDPEKVLLDWSAAHPAPGDPVSGLSPKVTRANGLSILTRIYRRGSETFGEGLLLVELKAGGYQVEVVRLPKDRPDVRNAQTKASSQVRAAIERGEYARASDDAPPSGGRVAQKETPAAGAQAAGDSSKPAKGTGQERDTLPKESPEATAKRMRALAARIQTVGFLNQTTMGVGGTIMFTPEPVVLFDTGDALEVMKDLRRMDSIESERAARPKHWKRWRKADGRLEIEGKKGWSALDYTKTMGPLRSGFTLDGSYGHLSGAGNTAMGGTTSVAAWVTWKFERNGAFALRKGAAASSSAKGGDRETHTTTTSDSGVRSGRYSIDGYLLTIRFDDGADEVHLIVAEADSPKTVWIDGDGYTSK